MELDVRRHWIANRFRCPGSRLWHVQVLEYDLLDYEKLFRGEIDGGRSRGNRGLVVCLPFDLRHRSEQLRWTRRPWQQGEISACSASHTGRHNGAGPFRTRFT